MLELKPVLSVRIARVVTLAGLAIRTILLSLIVVAATPAAAQEAKDPPLSVQVLRSGPGSLYANFSLIEGKHDAVLVDAPFTVADAHRVVAMILDSGKHLTYVFVTHDHPDHFFSMEVIQDAFPDAKIVANPTVVADIWRSLPFKVKRWSPMLSANGPRHPSAPLPLDGDFIPLEGQQLKVIGPMQGDHEHATALWAPSISALFAGDLLFNDMYLWFGEHDLDQVKAWRRSIDQLAALKPKIIVAGHSRPGVTDDLASLAFTRDYLDQWPQLVAQSADSAQLRALVKSRFPQAVDVLDDFLLGHSSRIAKGEEPKWHE